MIEGGKSVKQSMNTRGQGAGRFGLNQEGGKIGSQAIQITSDDIEENSTKNPLNLGNKLQQESKKGMIVLPKEMGSQDALFGEADPSQAARSPDKISIRCKPLMEERSLPSHHRRLSTVNEGEIISYAPAIWGVTIHSNTILTEGGRKF
ncbi:hypothetical protein U1Q18_024836 [Sarracenia purpurea var. burkii]